nr:immunoglobulin heavy chain junction region [Mus musculus]
CARYWDDYDDGFAYW